MNTNKIAVQLTIVLVFAFSTIYPFTSFADDDSKKIVLKAEGNYLDKRHVESKQTLTFDKPITHQVKIENQFKEDIMVADDCVSIGDQFSVPVINRSFTISGLDGCAKIPAGKSCSFEITANPKAIPTLNPKGAPLIIKYRKKVYSKEEFKVFSEKDRFIEFNVQSNYNDHLRFGVRNVEFTKKEALDERASDWFEGELTIVNESSEYPVRIQDVTLANHGVRVGKLYYDDKNSCMALKKGESCKVTFIVDGNDEAIKDADVLPIWVTYDVLSPKVQDGLVAVAAAVFKTHSIEKLKAVLSGTVAAGSIVSAYNEFAASLFGLPEKLLIAVLPDSKYVSGPIKLATKAGIGLFAGGGYSFADELDKLYEYQSGNIYSKLIGSTTMYGAVATAFFGLNLYSHAADIKSGDIVGSRVSMFTLGSIATGLAPFAGTCVFCGMAAKYSTKYLADAIFDNVVYRLPEQKSYLKAGMDKTKLAFNFGVAAIIRAGCRIVSGIYPDGIRGMAVEVLQDILSAFAMPHAADGIDFVKDWYLGANRDLPSFPKNETLSSGLSPSCKTCICTELDGFGGGVDEL